MAASGGSAVRIRYPRGGAQSVAAAIATGGFQLTGAADIADFKDEVRHVPTTPGAPLPRKMTCHGGVCDALVRRCADVCMC